MTSRQYQPAVVVAAYNRPRSISRLLDSLRLSRISGEARLIISIDNNEPHNLNVKAIADNFEWPFGEKEVIYQPQHLGLRKHILKCAGLSQEYGSVIILEDDLFVSPFFYEYTIEALQYYGKDQKIGGISLYNQPIQDGEEYPFSAIEDGSDVYFMQFPSSYGQAWTKEQWAEFRAWYDSDPDLSSIPMPWYVKRWPETSWKKYFCAFLVVKNKYFVFPRISLTTNFNDPGANFKRLGNHEGQTQLKVFNEPNRFRKLNDSICRYDSHLELEAASVLHLSSHLKGYAFELDLYGTKDPQGVAAEYLVTSKSSMNPVMGFQRALKPHEMNIILDLKGEDFVLSRKEDILDTKNRHTRKIDNYKYFYTRNILGLKTQLINYYHRFKTRSGKR